MRLLGVDYSKEEGRNILAMTIIDTVNGKMNVMYSNVSEIPENKQEILNVLQNTFDKHNCDRIYANDEIRDVVAKIKTI